MSLVAHSRLALRDLIVPGSSGRSRREPAARRQSGSPATLLVSARFASRSRLGDARQRRRPTRLAHDRFRLRQASDHAIALAPKRSPGTTARDAEAIVRMRLRGRLAEPEDRLVVRPVGFAPWSLFRPLFLAFERVADQPDRGRP